MRDASSTGPRGGSSAAGPNPLIGKAPGARFAAIGDRGLDAADGLRARGSKPKPLVTGPALSAAGAND